MEYSNKSVGTYLKDFPEQELGRWSELEDERSQMQGKSGRTLFGGCERLETWFTLQPMSTKNIHKATVEWFAPHYVTCKNVIIIVHP